MQIVLSFCNIRSPGHPLLGLLDPVTGECKILDLPDHLASGPGLTGLASSPQLLFAVQQTDEARLLIFDRADLRLRTVYTFQLGRDVHSIWVDSDSLYAVSAGTDEVLRLTLQGICVTQETVFWRPEPAGPRSDNHHLNALCGHRGDVLVAGFGQKAGARWSTATDGFITNITQNRTVVTGIQHPHSVTTVGDTIAYCESRRMAVSVVGKGQVQPLPGYTRGLCSIGEALYVGTSVGRRVSKSTGAINNPGDHGILTGRCAVVRIALDTLAIEQIYDLTAYGAEIYDLLPVDGAQHWPTVSEIAWRDRAILGMWDSLTRETARAGQAETYLHERDAIIASLQPMLDEQTARAQHLGEEVAERDRLIRDIQTRLHQQTSLGRERDQQIQNLQAELAAIRSSTFWQIMSFYWALRKKLPR